MSCVVGRSTSRTLKVASEVGGGDNQGLAALGAEQRDTVPAIHVRHPRTVLLGCGWFCVALVRSMTAHHPSYARDFATLHALQRQGFPRPRGSVYPAALVRPALRPDDHRQDIMDDANTNMREESTRNGASCFGVMTGCFTLTFLLFSALTLVALGKRWVDPRSTSSASFLHPEEPSSSAVSNSSSQDERQGRVSLPARAKHLTGVIRNGPGKQYQLIAELPDGAPVVIIEETWVTEKMSGAGTWYKVRATWAKGPVIGWMHSDIVK